MSSRTKGMIKQMYVKGEYRIKKIASFVSDLSILMFNTMLLNMYR